MGATLVLGEPPVELTSWLARRKQLGQDLFDEIWEGEYHVAPMAHARHGDVAQQVGVLLHGPLRAHGLRPSGPVNLGEPQNFRVPDLVVLRERATTAYLPTAEIVVEVVSPGDESYRKFGFYFARGVREVLIVDPQRRAVEWFARGESAFERTDRSALLDLTEQSLADELDWPPPS